VKLAEFSDLCLREWGEARGEVISLSLTDESYEELAGETSKAVDRLINPLTRTEVKVAAGAATDTAEVRRHYARALEVTGDAEVPRGRLAIP
jgi:broad-specificity NMP kinase